MSASIVRGAYWAVRLDRHRPAGRVAEGYAITEAWWPDADQLAEAMGVPASVTRERFGCGVRAWAAWHWQVAGRADELAAWLWVSTVQQYDEPVRRELRFTPDEAYGWGAATLAAHRNRGLFTALLEHVGAEMLGEGRTVMWDGVHDHNLASRRAHIRVGFRPVLRVTAEQAGLIRTRAAEYADPELLRRARRMLGSAPHVQCAR